MEESVQPHSQAALRQRTSPRYELNVTKLYTRIHTLACANIYIYIYIYIYTHDIFSAIMFFFRLCLSSSFLRSTTFRKPALLLASGEDDGRSLTSPPLVYHRQSPVELINHIYLSRYLIKMNHAGVNM
jgi:hypothetical protein